MQPWLHNFKLGICKVSPIDYFFVSDLVYTKGVALFYELKMGRDCACHAQVHLGSHKFSWERTVIRLFLGFQIVMKCRKLISRNVIFCSLILLV